LLPGIIILKIAGEPKKEVDLNYMIDLRHGIEKLRLTPRQINNGELGAGRRVEFAMLPQDERHLDDLGLRWETLVDVITSQVPIENWHDVIADPTIADAVLDRLVHNAHRLALNGDSMRKITAQRAKLDATKKI